MGGSFRKLAAAGIWFEDAIRIDGPCVYELAIAGPRGGGLVIVYVGETGDACQRLSAYGNHGSHLRRAINRALRAGMILLVRARAMPSKQAAVAIEKEMLARHEYPWNLNSVPRRVA